MKCCFCMSPLCNIKYSGMSPLCNIYTSGMPAINMENTTGKMTISYRHTGSHIHACTPNMNLLADTCPSSLKYIGHYELIDNLLPNWLNFDQKDIGENIHFTLIFQSNSHEKGVIAMAILTLECWVIMVYTLLEFGWVSATSIHILGMGVICNICISRMSVIGNMYLCKHPSNIICP